MSEDTVSQASKKALIMKQPFFSVLNAEEVTVLADLFKEKHYYTNQMIVEEGDPVDSVLLIVEGKADVRHVRIDNKGALKIESLAVLGPGDSIGLSETGFYSLSGVRTATVTALSPLVSLYLSIAAFRGFALSNSHVSAMMRRYNHLQTPME